MKRFIGIIKKKDGSTYTSPILAFKYDAYESEAIVFDETFTRIVRMDVWKKMFLLGRSGHRTVFIVANDYGVKGNEWIGIDRVLNDEKLFSVLRPRKSVSVDRFPYLSAYAKEPELPKRMQLRTERDIEAFYDFSMAFHDGYVVEYRKQGENIVVKLDSTWDCCATMTFSGVVEDGFYEGKFRQIYSSEIRIENGLFTFSVEEDDWSDEDEEEKVPPPYIKCKKIYWEAEIC